MLEEKGRGLAAWVRNVYILVYYIGALFFLEFFNLRNLCVEIFVEVVNFGIATRTNSRRDFRLALLCLSFSLLLLFSFRLLFFLVIYAVAFCNTICLWLLLFLLSLYEYELLLGTRCRQWALVSARHFFAADSAIFSLCCRDSKHEKSISKFMYTQIESAQRRRNG